MGRRSNPRGLPVGALEDVSVELAALKSHEAGAAREKDFLEHALGLGITKEQACGILDWHYRSVVDLDAGLEGEAHPVGPLRGAGPGLEVLGIVEVEELEVQFGRQPQVGPLAQGQVQSRLRVEIDDEGRILNLSPIRAVTQGSQKR